MGNSFLGQLLVLVLCVVALGRVFFMRYNKVDSLCVAAPIALIAAILQILAWGLNPLNIIVFFLSLVVFFSNVRSLLRFTGGLYIDSYSVPFVLSSVVLLLATLFAIAFIIIFSPVVKSASYYNVVEKSTRLTGSFTSGFLPSRIFEKENCVITIFERSHLKDAAPKVIPDSATASNPATDTPKKTSGSIIFLGDKRATLFDYLPYIYTLAQSGYKVYYADFFTRDGLWAHNICDNKLLRKSFLRARYFLNPARFNSEQEFFSFNMAKELNMLYDYAVNTQKDDRIFIITDWMGDIALKDFQKEHSADGTFFGAAYLSSLESYKTAGFGFCDYTEPLISVFLKMQKEHYASFIEATKSYFASKTNINDYLTAVTSNLLGEKERKTINEVNYDTN